MAPKNQDQVVLITGCSSGFGFLTARLLARKGYTVYATMRDITTRNKDKKIELENTTADTRGKISVLEIDVLDQTSITASINEIIQREGKIDVLVNNAGYSLFGPIEFGNQEMIDHMFETNILGYIRMIKAVLPHMRARRAGKILNVSSMMGLFAVPYNGYYSATKFAVMGLSQAMLGECYLFNIKVCIVAPMGYNTDFFGRSGKKIVEIENSGEYKIPFSNIIENYENFGNISGNPEDVAKKIEFVIKKKNPAFLNPVGKFARLSMILTKIFNPLSLQKFMAKVYGFDKLFKKIDT